ncbi:MAG: DUF2461 domain-containing protein [Anaerolineae bacterium]|nr:DUF2461 domain-containing protein [Anaerolineae bacterium]
MPESLRLALDFLRDLNRNNDREWFKANKKRYDAARAAHEIFIAEVLARFDEVEDVGPLTPPETLYRIHRDIRFSPDKTPYKPWMGALIGPQGRKTLGSAYYIQIQPGGSMIAGGLYMPSSEALQAIRESIAADARPLKAVLASESFVRSFGSIEGEQLKTAPKGFSKDHPEIALLRYKQFLAVHNISDEDVVKDDLVDRVITVCKALKPFSDYFYDRIDPAILEKMARPG